jgi:valine dehydrogenase (NAD+)
MPDNGWIGIEPEVGTIAPPLGLNRSIPDSIRSVRAGALRAVRCEAGRTTPATLPSAHSPAPPPRVDQRKRVTTVTAPASASRASVFERLAGHEQVVFCHDEATGLRAIVAIHSTALGPALGGTRFYPYASEEEALEDVLALSRGMTYKAAAAGLDLGGGKAVIIGDPARQKTEGLLRAYGRFIESLGGRYRTACDVGTFSEDMDIVARESRFVTGRTVAQGGAGDSSVLTAFGVFQGMRAAAEVTWGRPTLRDRVVGVAGVGKVGRHLVQHLVEDGAEVVVTDVNPAAVAAVEQGHRSVRSVGSVDELVREPLDVYAPCALGGALDDDVVAVLRAKVVCGAANNQLAHAGMDKILSDAGLLYAPDYLVNSGGLIQVADELHGFSFDRARARAAGIFDSTRQVFRIAEQDGVPPAVAADRLAERRIAEVGRLRGIWTG